MKFAVSFVALLATVVVFTRAADRAPAKKDEAKPKVEVCFVLDTTGSMSGLIQGAKTKIWAIANQIIGQKPTPDVRVALIGYRDRGDEYVTKRFDLTEDIDAVFKNLNGFEAQGGGDEPESVNLALDEAVNKISWSADRKVLKVIFLVGDAPPHMDYAGEKQYPAICKEAVKKDLIINTVQCGDLAGTRPVWQEISKLSEGEYAAIGQTGDVAVIEAPQDKEIAKLTADLGGTLIPVAINGSTFDAASTGLYRAQGAATSAPASVTADRARYMLRLSSTTQPVGAAATYYSGIRVSTARNELIDQLAEGTVKLAELKDEQLPPEMRKMSQEEREKHVAAKAAERKAIQAKIAELTTARQAYVEAEQKRRANAAVAAEKKDAFDEKVLEILTRQAEAKKR
jgi:hypothetical protein